jgi:predicted nuclease of predicted toxin-antitoxin system
MMAMLRLLLDEHLSPDIATHLRRHLPDLVVYSLQEWEDGAFDRPSGDSDDALILRTAHTHGLTLVTYDQRTIRPSLKAWGEQGFTHSGVIFLSRRTVTSSNIGVIVRALTELWQQYGQAEWTDRVHYLTVPGR